jgi:hypothetical protein
MQIASFLYSDFYSNFIHVSQGAYHPKVYYRFFCGDSELNR